jgi:hypothetical protein
MDSARRSTRGGRGLLAMLGVLAIVVTVAAIYIFFGSRTRNVALSSEDGALADTSRGSRSPSSEAPSRVTPWPSFSGPSSARANADRLFRPIRREAISKAKARFSIEAMAVEKDEYFRGMLDTARALDPEVIPAMRDQLEANMCNGPADTDVDLILYARMILVDRTVGTQRGLDCAIQHHHQEDVVLWTLLDAWNAMGRPALSDQSFLQTAMDDRTRKRLMPPDDRARRAIEFKQTIQNRRARGFVP